MTDTKSLTPESALAPAEQIASRLSLDLLTRGRVVVIGLGGIGLILSRYITLFLSAFRDREFRVVLCDGDSFESSNTYRMDVPDFANKAAAVAGDLEKRFGRPGLHLRWVPEYITAKKAARIIREGDVVLAAVDNHATRRVIGRRCAKLRDVVLFSGGNDGVEGGAAGTYGNVQVFARAAGRDLHPPLEQFHPEIANPVDRNPADLDCLELGAAAVPQLLFTNLAVASAMCNAFLRTLVTGAGQAYDEVCFDTLEARSTPHRMFVPPTDNRSGSRRRTTRRS
jgi:molybdopterin/thiamine biosynthesis adenylyltransferase